MIELFLATFSQPGFWLGLCQIIWIDILLSGDNALVIAMVCKGLPEHQRRMGVVVGAGGAVAMRIVFAGIITTLMEIPFLKVVGGLALIYVAIKLLAPQAEEDGHVKPATSIWAAIVTIAVADATMSLDNVIAVAAAAHGSVVLMALGLLISIPLIVVGASLIVSVLDKAPFLIWAGAALLGWIAGEVIAGDPLIHAYIGHSGEMVAAISGALIVMLAGYVWRRSSAASAAPALS